MNESIPKFNKQRPIPFGIREPVKEELDRMVSSGIINSVKTSSWAAPVVCVLNAIHPTIKKTPAMLFKGRNLRTSENEENNSQNDIQEPKEIRRTARTIPPPQRFKIFNFKGGEVVRVNIKYKINNVAFLE